MANIAAYGIALKQGDGGSPESFTDIAQVVNLGGPSLKLDPLDVTNHGSTSGWREFIGGLLDAGEVTLELNYDPAEGTHDATTGLIADMTARTVRNFQLVFPDSGSTLWSFAALVTGFEIGAPVDGKLTASATLKLSGQPTLS